MSWRPNVISVAHDSSIYQAMNSIEKKRIHGLPVVDADNRCLGLLSAWKVSQYLFPHREGAPTSRELFGLIADIAHSFDGEFVAGISDHTRKKVNLMVAAMSQASFGERVRSIHTGEVIVFVGDREEIRAGRDRSQGSFCSDHWRYWNLGKGPGSGEKCGSPIS